MFCCAGKVKKGEEIYVDYGDEYDWGDNVPVEAPEPELDDDVVEVDEMEEDDEDEADDDLELGEEEGSEVAKSDDDYEDESLKSRKTKKAFVPTGRVTRQSRGGVRTTELTRTVGPVFGSKQGGRVVVSVEDGGEDEGKWRRGG